MVVDALQSCVLATLLCAVALGGVLQHCVQVAWCSSATWMRIGVQRRCSMLWWCTRPGSENARGHSAVAATTSLWGLPALWVHLTTWLILAYDGDQAPSGAGCSTKLVVWWLETRCMGPPSANSVGFRFPAVVASVSHITCATCCDAAQYWNP